MAKRGGKVPRNDLAPGADEGAVPDGTASGTPGQDAADVRRWARINKAKRHTEEAGDDQDYSVSPPKVDGRKGKGRPHGAINKPKAEERPQTGYDRRHSKSDKLNRHHQQLADGVHSVFGHLTEDEIQAIKPVDVFRLVTIFGVRTENYPLAMAAAERWAPYVHAKLAPKIVETEEPAIIIKGGLPERPKQLN